MFPKMAINNTIQLEGTAYSPISVLAHIGPSKEHGHNMTYRKYQDGWYSFDDRLIARIGTDLDQELHKNDYENRPIPYMILYKNESIT